VKPGDLCVIKARIEKATKHYILASGEIEVDGRKVSTAEILYGLIERNKIDTPRDETWSHGFDAVIRDFLDTKAAASAQLAVQPAAQPAEGDA
jgi:hypothetical protein